MASQITDSTPHHKGKDSVTFRKDSTGTMKIPAKDLSIIWGEDDRYWKISHDPNEPSVLHQVSWLEVTGCVDGTNPKKGYEVGFTLSFAEDAFGWKKYPVYLMIKRGGKSPTWIKKMLINAEANVFKVVGPAEKGDGGGDGDRIYFGLYEVWSGYWKGGLKIHNAFVQEKNYC